MKLLQPLLLIVVTLLTACANPLNRVTSDNYTETCLVAEETGQLEVAEQACYRALVNVEIGNLDPELKSQSLYNLGRIKRRLAKFSEAELLLKKSLQIEEEIRGQSEVKVGIRLIELSVSLAGQNKWSEGGLFLERALPIVGQLSGNERAYSAEVLNQYSKQLKSSDERELAKRFEAKAVELE